MKTTLVLGKVIRHKVGKSMVMLHSQPTVPCYLHPYIRNEIKNWTHEAVIRRIENYEAGIMRGCQDLD
jgi:hypothetical protein